jgi:hypothetical protein
MKECRDRQSVGSGTATVLWGVEIGMIGLYLPYLVVACSATATLSLVTMSPADAQTRAALELFTSQGCSSCPPADKLLGELAADPTLVVMSLPIDYWDYLGWKDTLADPHNTLRQKAYAKARGDREVYTPQVVVNGSMHVLGSDKAAIERAIAQSREKAMKFAVTLSVAGDHIVVSVPDHAARAEIWVCGLAKAVTVMIKRGENHGKTITYSNVARRWYKLDAAGGKGGSFTVPISKFDSDGVDSAAVLVQTGTTEKPNAMLGAAFTSIR